ncbi:tRNA 2-selenouridine(34) synthase MnmH [Lyngbya confervoides]|uniref:tRNA 2-selenouridine(34) synthase MnmH n=1 Tax=Lyngbya confervoides BDU141951 TaxID=1574623 RepID=A0ABD4TCI3_9CYAN|nr:tRNA 2-selenouridine(34) synthase MnmH [Lyngbya confervoides]MCM1985375.1 tRNA 2-selenouridine(34) synthase MnmH [Lyngbya confervoides BDU141951]
MGLQPVLTDYPWDQSFSEIIDVRSPSEFAEDHIPEALNLPVLNDHQRAEVGKVYKQISPFAARKLGAALVSQNIAVHLQQHFGTKPKTYRPLIYCWRGGQRSQSLALVLTQVGWRTALLRGGYKSYRHFVRESLNQLPDQFSFNVLWGLTGTAKTGILQRMQQKGSAVLDLEHLACHRGSLLGSLDEMPQPSQKGFESRLVEVLRSFPAGQTLWIEAESSKIGQVFIPGPLWKRLKHSPCVAVDAPIQGRVAYLCENYPRFAQDLAGLRPKLQQLKARYGKIQIERWNQLIAAQKVPEIVQSLLEVHYDPAYRRSMGQQYLDPILTLVLPDLKAKTLEQTAQTLISLDLRSTAQGSRVTL